MTSWLGTEISKSFFTVYYFKGWLVYVYVDFDVYYLPTLHTVVYIKISQRFTVPLPSKHLYKLKRPRRILYLFYTSFEPGEITTCCFCVVSCTVFFSCSMTSNIFSHNVFLFFPHSVSIRLRIRIDGMVNFVLYTRTCYERVNKSNML